MNTRAMRQNELAATVRGEIRRAAESAGKAFEGLQHLSGLGLAAADELFSEATPSELRAFACHLRALTARSAESCSEIADVAGRIDALAAVREVTQP